MKKILSRTHRQTVVLMSLLIAALGFAPQVFSAVLIANADLNGDGIKEQIYNTGSTITVKNRQGATERIYYVGGTWAMVGIADLDGNPGAEVVARTYGDLVVITHRQRQVYPYPVSVLSGLWTVATIDQFDGVAGNEVAIADALLIAGRSSYIFIHHKTRTIRQHHFAAAGNWGALAFNDFDGIAGKEVAMSTGALHHVAILHPRTLVPHYYYVGVIQQLVSVSNLDGVAGNELRVMSNTGVVFTINDRKRTVTF